MFTVGLSSCQNENLDGHWHVSSDDYNFNVTFDIIDTNIILNKYELTNNPPGFLDKGSKIISFLSFKAEYTIKRNKLKMFGFGYNDEGSAFTGIKCDSNCCSFYEHTFENLLVKIDLPTTSKANKTITFPLINRNKSILFIGKPIREDLEKTSFIQMNDAFGGISDIQPWINAGVHHPKDLHQFIICASKETDPLFINQIISAINLSEEQAVFQVFRKENSVLGTSPFCLIRVKQNKSLLLE